MTDFTYKNRPLRRSAGANSYRLIALAVLGMLLTTGCSRSPQENAVYHIGKAKGYEAKNEYKKAIIEYKIASQSMPKDPEPRYLMGMAYFKAGSPLEAVQAFKGAVGVSPKHLGSRYQLALLRLNGGTTEEIQGVKAVIQEYLGARKDDVEATGALALAEAELGNPNEALRLLDVVAAKDSNIRAASAIVQYYAQKGEIEPAKRVARNMAEKLPKSPDAAVLIAQVLLATKDTDGADKEVARALAIKKDFLPAMQLQLRRELMTGNTAAAEETTKGMSKLPGKQLWSAYARMLFAEKKIDQGISEYERILKEHNNDAEIRNEMAEALITAGRKKEARVILEATLDKNKKDRAALLMRTSVQIDEGNLEGASKDIKTLLDLKAFSAPLSYQQSRIFAIRRETTRQGDLLAEALKYNPRFFIARLELAQLLIGAGKAKNALDVLDEATPNEKVSLEFRYYHNAAVLATGDNAQARKDVDECLKIIRSAGFLYQDAILKGRAKDIAGAKASLEAAFAIAPTESGVLGLLGEVLRQTGESQKFIALLRDALTKNPNAANLRTTLAGQLMAAGDKDGARKELEAAKATGDTNANLDLAQLDLATGSPDKAEKRLNDMIQVKDNASARVLLADVLMRKNDIDGAVKQYLRVVQMEPQNVLAMNNLAELLASKQKKFDDAVFWAQKALAAAPNNPAAADTLGWTYFRQGKFEAALPHLEASLRTLDRPTAHYHLAAAYMKTGSASRARSEYEAGIKQAPDSPARKEVSALFEGTK